MNLALTGLFKHPVSNDEVNHRIVFFEMPGLVVDPDKPRHARLQHVAFEYETLDDLLGTYARLKGLGILPGHGVARRSPFCGYESESLLPLDISFCVKRLTL